MSQFDMVAEIILNILHTGQLFCPVRLSLLGLAARFAAFAFGCIGLFYLPYIERLGILLIRYVGIVYQLHRASLLRAVGLQL